MKVFLFLACIATSVGSHSILEIDPSVGYGAKCPACSRGLIPCFTCGSFLKCLSCLHCWGCGKNGL